MTNVFFSCYCSDAHNNADPKDLSNALLSCGLSLVYEAFFLKIMHFRWRKTFSTGGSLSTILLSQKPNKQWTSIKLLHFMGQFDTAIVQCQLSWAAKLQIALRFLPKTVPQATKCSTRPKPHISWKKRDFVKTTKNTKRHSKKYIKSIRHINTHNEPALTVVHPLINSAPLNRAAIFVWPW